MFSIPLYLTRFRDVYRRFENEFGNAMASVKGLKSCVEAMDADFQKAQTDYNQMQKDLTAARKDQGQAERRTGRIVEAAVRVLHELDKPGRGPTWNKARLHFERLIGSAGAAPNANMVADALEKLLALANQNNWRHLEAIDGNRLVTLIVWEPSSTSGVTREPRHPFTFASDVLKWLTDYEPDEEIDRLRLGEEDEDQEGDE